LFVVLAIGLQNVPEGTSVAIPMQSAGFGRAQQFWAAVLTSAPQPVGAVVAYLAVEHITGLLPFSFAFAAGAMLSLVIVELMPQAFARGGRSGATAGTLAGAALMLVLALTLGVD
jgi:ZIP family zinc transporter